MRRISVTYRAVGWLAVAGLLAGAIAGPAAGAVSAASLNGAIWTSLGDGTTVNANLYDAKTDVYLNGGPQNCDKSNGGLPDGDYYFQVSDPSGGNLLSTDAIKLRQIKVVKGVIDGVSGLGNHATGTDTDCGTHPVQLFPYADTSNNGGEYSVDMSPIADVIACPGYDPDATFNFLKCPSTGSKNDNFKVGTSTPSTAPTPTPVATATPTATAVATATPTATPVPTFAPSGGVLGETGTPGTTPPPTDSIATARPSDDGTRLVLLAAAAIIATLLILTPSPASRRRR